MYKILLCCIVTLAACSNENNPPASSTPKTAQLIKNAIIIDGSGAAGYPGDIRFNQYEIIAVGKLDALESDEVVFANGMVVAPGFIDTHSHHDIGLDDAPQAIAAVSQGITTIVAGNDGNSNFPLIEFKQKLENNPPAINVASYTGHGTIRFEVMGSDYKREANHLEIKEMKNILAIELEQGSLGLATGLEYDPGIYSNTHEVIELAKIAAANEARYASHMRSEDRNFHAAIEELIMIGKEAELPVQISHIKLAAINIWGQADDVISRLETAREEGIDVTADIYPYTFWQSTLTVLLPDRDFNDLDAARFALENLAPADGLTLAHYAPDPELVGKNIAEIATARGKSNEETYLQLIRDAYEGYTDEELANMKDPRESVMGVSMSEPDIATLVGWPHSNICSDGASEGHPRGYGAFPRAIRKYVREQGIVTLEDMIRKMTSLSAAHVGIENRGLISPGYAADLVLLNPDTITDNATIEHHDRLADGIIRVWVNGENVWLNRQSTGARPGVFVARAQDKYAQQE